MKLKTTMRIKACLLIPAIFINIFTGFLFPAIGGAETCEQWVAQVVSVQGSVQARRVGETEWTPVKLNDTYCPGDMIRVGERGRVAVILRNENILRLDQKTTITFAGLEKEQTFLLDLLTGAVHFFSRIPRTLKVITPFVNAAVEGTEFFVLVERDQTFLSIFEGRVAATNELGSLTVTSGQSAVAQAGQAPALRIVVRPRDAVQWALYYPAILDYRPGDFPGGVETGWEAMVRKSIEFYWEGDPARAFSSLEGAPEDIPDPRFSTYRAALLLSVGRVDEARVDIEGALNLDPTNSHAFALRSLIAVVQNEKDRALDLAEKAVGLDPKSSAARVALSYAQQANFDLQGALESIKEAVKLDPKNPLACARLAELWLSVGNLKKAVDAAQEAVALNPKLAHTQAVLGFAYLTKIKIRDAKKAFEKAIEMDQAAPLPRLGLGLAKIRQGKLKAGRDEIGIAASLDPNNSLIRSYLGKAYFEEKRDKLAKGQFAIARELDPLDPTPWFYDAIRKQAVNRPVEALQDLQKSIELNDNRAIYRSRLLLDEDLAARSASLGRIYDELGFQQLALVEGWKSLNIDPSNYSAHRFLADTYSTLPRHEIARVSELLKSQLLQPINISPVQPQLAESDLFILSGAGPASPSLNEFNPLFNRNRFALLASGVAGGNDTLGDEVVHSGVWGRLSYSVGQFHYETDGFRENNDLEQDIYNVFTQVSLSHKTSLQAEFRHKDIEKGDLPLRFDPTDFLPTLRQGERTNSVRLGFHHAFTPHSDLIGSFIYGMADFDTETEINVPFPPFLVQSDLATDEDGYLAEVQHLFRFERFQVTGGVGYYSADSDETGTFQPQVPPILVNSSSTQSIRHTNLYVYSLIGYPKNFTWTIGGSADFFDSEILDRDQFNPKFGLTWNPIPNTTVRAAVLRVLRRMLISEQTIEPTQVAGFNQFFDDTRGTESWRYGIGIDQKFPRDIYGGVEYSERDLEVPVRDPTLGGQVRETDREEKLGRAYLYWTPHPWVALSAEYQFERFERQPDLPGVENIVKLETHRIPLGISFFHPWGFSARLKATYIDQEGEFGSSTLGVQTEDDQFWIVDASIGYRLPKRWGLITIEAKNLFDEEFNFQDTDPANPRIYPERFIFARFTLAL
jgi:tetratricopeptide (TPR) repeat protein